MIAYLRDPDEIYAKSFATIRSEANLSGLPKEAHDIAIRVIHASGMTDLAPHLACSPNFAASARQALSCCARIIVDSEMVRAGFLSSHRPLRNPVICCIGDENVREFATRQKTTRSAAAVEFWKPILGGAIVVIGNAPTALFALLEALDSGAPKPAAVIAMPVGFVGAAESKDELIRDPRGTEYFTLRGRRGGSAMAAAALNALIENYTA